MKNNRRYFSGRKAAQSAAGALRYRAPHSRIDAENRRPAPGERGKNMKTGIAETTREERERIVTESIGNISGLCDGCSPGIIEMYRDYIDGKKELREINAEFRASYMSGSPDGRRSACPGP